MVEASIAPAEPWEKQRIEEIMRWTVKQVVDAVAGKQGSGIDPLARVAGVSIDSRTIRRGELSSPFTVRVTMDTTTWPQFWRRAPWRQWSRNLFSRAIRDGRRIAVSPCPTHSKHSTIWPAPSARIGERKSAASPGPWGRPLPKRSWRHYWARSCGS